MNLQAEWKGRLRYWTHALEQDFYHPLGELPLEGFVTGEQLTPEAALARPFTPMPEGTAWGQEWEYAWMRCDFVLPDEAEGACIVLELNPGGEAAVFVDGAAFGARRADWVNVPHHLIEDNILCESGRAGERHTVLLEAYAGHFIPEGALGGVSAGPVLPGTLEDPLKGKTRRTVGRSTFGVWNEAAYQLWLDVRTLTEVMENLPDGSLRAAKIAKGLRAFTLAVDFEQPRERRLADYARARQLLRPLLEAKNGDTAPVFYAVGNSHLDVAWLWPCEETVRKTARTFSQQLRLLEKYPEYRYIQSQPQTYLMCKEHYPELYERIRQAVRQGRWIVEGAMWVEPDTNMASGESLIRQLLYGLRFFREEFGVECEILWLPDTFGYSAVLPQLLKGFGVNYLVTQKIFWSYNEGERFPYHYFTWRGNDGSEVVSFLPTSYSYRTNPQTLMKTWENRVEKDEMGRFLLPFGYGDGGGGPTRDYIEFAQRQADLEGAPRVRMEHPAALFRDLEREGGPEHQYVGELYFNAHRGVYTSQAGVKRGNRKGELALREAELWAAAAWAMRGADYPARELEAAWKTLLLNQFHDILPGSCIARVYERAAAEHRQVAAAGARVAAAGAAALAGEGGNLCVFNSLSWQRDVLVELPDDFGGAAGTAEGMALPVAQVDGRTLAHVSVPPCGCVTLVPGGRSMPSGLAAEAGVTAEAGADGAVLENAKIRAVLNPNGEVVSFVLKSSGREFAAGPMNRFDLFKDVPRLFDAWDIDSPYEQQRVELEGEARLTLAWQSPLSAAVRLERTAGNSTLRQIISLAADSTRLEFDTTVDWRELHRLLKVSFPVQVHADEALNEIQFGYVKRPTHRSRPADKDRFEVCNHRYTALCDGSHGAAVLNDCKYGVSQLGNTISLSLLRAAASPEMRADNGEQRFTYAFTAWEGPFAASDVVRQGYEINTPVTAVRGGSWSGSVFSVSHPGVILETVKRAEDGDALILRLYEAMGGDCTAQVSFPPVFRCAALCRMDETVRAPLSAQDGVVSLHFGPFQVVTVRLSR